MNEKKSNFKNCFMTPSLDYDSCVEVSLKLSKF